MTLADKADKLIELWVRELAQESANPYKAHSLLDGHFALEVGGKKKGGVFFEKHRQKDSYLTRQEK